jgi:de-etiolated-1
MIFEQVQFLDRHHLFIKFGSVDGGVSHFFPAKYSGQTTSSVQSMKTQLKSYLEVFKKF